MNVDNFSGLRNDVEIAGSIRFRGYLTFDGKLRDGNITGEDLLVGPEAVIRGNIKVASLILHGSVTGEVVVTGHCELKSTASLTGNLVSNRLIMHEGAALLADVVIAPDSSKIAAAKTAPAKTASGKTAPA